MPSPTRNGPVTAGWFAGSTESPLPVPPGTPPGRPSVAPPTSTPAGAPSLRASVTVAGSGSTLDGVSNGAATGVSIALAGGGAGRAETAGEERSAGFRAGGDTTATGSNDTRS